MIECRRREPEEREESGIDHFHAVAMQQRPGTFRAVSF
jgi:hypothetical protein